MAQSYTSEEFEKMAEKYPDFNFAFCQHQPEPHVVNVPMEAILDSGDKGKIRDGD